MSTIGTPTISQQERSDLILAHLPRVRWIARGIRERLPQAIALEDLVSIGVLGLIAAIDRFDASQNVKLTTYADYRIRGSILDSVRGADGVPAHKRPKRKMMHNAAAGAAQRLQKAPDEEQIAAELGISVDMYHAWLIDVRPHALSSLDATFRVGSQSVKLADVLADDSAHGPDQRLERIELRQLIERALSALPPAQHRVMQFYYREGLHIPEIAGILGLHPSRVWQMKNEATARVRDFIREHWTLSKSRKLAGRSEQGRYAVVA